MPKNIIRRVSLNLARRLHEARRETGLSTRAVVKRLTRRVAMSHATLASYENGTTVPPVDTLGVLAAFYKRPLNWFLEDRETLVDFRYRNLPPRVPLAEQRRFEAIAGKWAEAYQRLDDVLQTDRSRISDWVGISGSVTPEELAETIRREYLNLEDTQPIQNMINVLESFSAWALEVRTPFNADGAAGRLGEDFVVVVNPVIANERIRLNAAHELARIVYGKCQESPVATDEDADKMAYRFASSILLPDSQLREAFKDRSFLRLIQFKERFGVSLISMIYAAEKNDIITSTVARRLWSEVARRGWRQREPGYVWRDRAIGFEMLLEWAIVTKALSWADAERVTGVREPELRQRLDDALNSDAGPSATTERQVTIKLTGTGVEGAGIGVKHGMASRGSSNGLEEKD